MNEERHTPLPWKFVPWHIEEGPSAVRAPAGHIVCTTASDADAKLIVRSVDAMPALVEALEEADGLINRIHRAFGAPGDWGYGDPKGDALFKLCRFQQDVHAVLAKVKEPS